MGFYVKYWPTRIKLRRLKSLVGSQMGRSTDEAVNDGGREGPRVNINLSRGNAVWDNRATQRRQRN